MKFTVKQIQKMLLMMIVAFTFAVATVSFGFSMNPDKPTKVSLVKFKQTPPMDEEESHSESSNSSDGEESDSGSSDYVFLSGSQRFVLSHHWFRFFAENTFSSSWSPSPDHRPPLAV